MAPPSLQFVSANGVRFAYLEEGSGPLVLLVHGFPDTAHSWDAVRPALAAAGYRAVSPFTRGYFPSAIPADGAYDADTLGRDLLGLIDALGGDPAIVVGHDFGAGAAYSAASIAPERVRRLVVIGIPHPASVIPTPKLLWTVRHFFTFNFPGAAAKARRDHFAEIDEMVRRWSPAWDVPAGETAAVKESFAQPGCLEAALGYYRALRPWLPASQYRRIAVPSVAFAGEHDTIPVKLYDQARSRFAGSYEVVAMPGGHFMHREHPAHFIRELLGVLGPSTAQAASNSARSAT